MIEMRVSDAAEALQGAFFGADRRFFGCSTDSRSVHPDQLFVALRGPRFDGHDFVVKALADGAAAAMVERGFRTEVVPRIEVYDTRYALGELARVWRERVGSTLIAVTGSNGKTTVKNMLAAILAELGAVHATAGNLNNDIGVPLTLFELDDGDKWAVIEMGANHPGEISRLCEIARPQVAIVTQCAPAHLEGFGSVAGVAKAKGEIYSKLSASGTAIINADDPYAGLWLSLAGTRRVLTFAINAKADVQAVDLVPSMRPWGTRFTMRIPGDNVAVTVPLPGRHNVMNALAAAACAFSVGCPPEQIVRGLAKVSAAPGRLQLAQYNGQQILDDSYNANPASLDAAFEVLLGLPGPRWLVLGDMAELGADAERLHVEAGRRAADLGIEKIYTIGALASAAGKGFGDTSREFQSMDELISALRKDLPAAVSVLVKGSRSMHMERIVAALSREKH
jgi:UDP-N-acetylmuramoyl-tripeptide--D-alanyl-D-alanine ligase